PTADYWRPIYEPVFDSESVLPAARELATYSNADDLVVMVGRGFDPDVLYYARRTGLLITFENGSAALYRTLPAVPYRVFFSWDPAHDAIDIMRWWTWNGAVGPLTYVIGADPSPPVVSVRDRSPSSASSARRHRLDDHRPRGSHLASCGYRMTGQMSKPAPYDVCVIGGAGHVGAPLSIVLASRGLRTVAY